MYRLVSFFVLFTFVTVLLYFHNENSHYSASGQMDHHMEQEIEIPLDLQKIPSVSGKVKQDNTGSWYLFIETSNFTFAPEKVGYEKIQYNEGHAHLYVDGKKINRIYDNYYHIGNLDEGTHEIKVTLNGHNHGVFSTTVSKFRLWRK